MDGTYILSFRPNDRQERFPEIAIVQWHLPTYEHFEPDVDEPDLYHKVIKQVGSGFWVGGPFTPWGATHWMPLPEPPK